MQEKVTYKDGNYTLVSALEAKNTPSSTTRLWKYQQLMMCNPNVNKLLAAGALVSYTPYDRKSKRQIKITDVIT